MKVVKVRSPFVIEVTEAGQIGSKIELFIWRQGEVPPISPRYTLSKPSPDPTNVSNYYNISNFVKEFIDNIAPLYTDVPLGDYNENFALFKVKRYWNNAGTYVLIDTTEYVGVNGFTQYMDGLQYAVNSRVDLLFNPNIKNNYQIQNTYPTNTIQYLNILVEYKTLLDNLNITYNRIDGVTYSTAINFDNLIGVYLYRIPISLVKSDSAYVNGCSVTITLTPGDDVTPPIVFDPFYTYPICEPKYTPVLIDFINREGGWQTLTFYKAQTNNLSVKNSDYKLSPDNVNYTALRGQNKSFNFVGTQTIKVNSGWIDESYNELITDLLLSETVLLDRKPVIVKTQGTELKTKLKNRLINYEIDFEYSYNLINDAI
jgi:hypothetical protein